MMYIKAIDGSPPQPPNPVHNAPQTYETLYCYNTHGRMYIPLRTTTCYIHYDFGVEYDYLEHVPIDK